MSERYQVGVRCAWLDANPGFEAVVDMGTPFAFGAVVALVDGREMAERIARLLNADEMSLHDAKNR